MRGRIMAWMCGVVLTVVAMGSARGDWRDTISDPKPGDFPALRTVKLSYECGWSGLTAGEATVSIAHPSPDVCVLDATAATVGLARALWRLDATHEAQGNAVTLLPVSIRQKEVYKYQTIRTDLDFNEAGVMHFRQSTNEKNPARRKWYDFTDLHDLQTALLYLRSQKLENGKVYRIVVYPGTSPYVATVTVLGREPLKVKAGSYPAIKVDLKLEKINGEMKLEPHGKFKRATAWISDDRDRIPLRMNAQIFVGSVWVELVKVE